MSGQAVTAIVVSYRTGPYLRDCLHALTSDPEITGVVIVDNGNPPEAQDWLASFAETQASVTLLTPGQNLGFGAGVNLGARSAPDGYLLLINPDAILKRGSAGTLIQASHERARPTIAGGKVFDTYGREGRGCRRRKLTLWRAITSYAGWNTWTLEHEPEPNAPVRMDAVSGALMLVDTASFARLGGFDEGYFLHVEDIDLCRRAWEAGGEVVYCPSAGALHYGATSDAPSKLVARHKADSLARYFRKFAANPLEKALAALLAPVLKWLLVARARH
ncbi:glycosyltransferase family 2 protein [Henriciella aquimarina]|uniref:glycosyltransferase family 2 protein n=1 Tax=Henriciella aquimarina TaxID=545261 RepID=UPI000A038E11|nr:glycosyltransferase family 2 protein [Henriciella aquimarina]